MFPPYRVALLTLLMSALAVSQGVNTDEEREPSHRYTGTPLVLPVDCADEDATGFSATCPTGQPCEIGIELSAVTSVRERVFLAGEFHNGTQSLASFLLLSEDGGQSWDEVHERMPGVVLNRLYFHDETTGWATGHALTFPPKDPFFMLTTDGGKHWRRRDIYPTPEIGVIQEFWFNDDKSGGLLIDRVQGAEAGRRFERYETMTGAASWMIREVSATPIRVRNVIPADPDPNWRLRNDSDRGAWQVEQHQPGGWAAVAEFSSTVATCQPQTMLAAEPEPATEPREGEAEVAPGGVLVIRRDEIDR